MQRWLLISLGALVAIALTTTAPILSAQPPHMLFVSPRGDDANPGTEARPFRTIQHAADLIVPGETVTVEDGVYTADGEVCSARPVVCINHGGTASAWVTFRARHPGGAKIDGSQNARTHGFLFRSGASFVVIDGFDIYGMGLPDMAVTGAAHGVMIDVGHDVVLTRLTVHDIGRGCTSTGYGLTGVFVRVPRVAIMRSVFHDIGRFASGEHGCSVNVAPRFDHAIYISGEYSNASTPGASDVLIADNVFHHIERGWAVHVYPGTVSRLNIVNNTFAFPHPSEPGQIILAASTSDSSIANNIFFHPRAAAIDYDKGTQKNLSIRNNVVSGAQLMTALPPGAVTEANRAGDPRFVNAVAPPYDFHLTPQSAAVGAGVAVAQVQGDFDGMPRAGGRIDAGAYQLAR